MSYANNDTHSKLIIYLLTGGLFGLGLLFDLWTLNGQVSEINRHTSLAY